MQIVLNLSLVPAVKVAMDQMSVATGMYVSVRADGKSVAPFPTSAGFAAVPAIRQALDLKRSSL